MSSNMVDVLPPLQPQPSHSALHTAVISSDVDQVSQLLKLILSSSSSSLKPNLLGYTPLHSATCLKRNSLEITKLILSVGAEVMESDNDGNTALHWAVRGGNSDVVHTLIIRNCLLGKFTMHILRLSFLVNRISCSFLILCIGKEFFYTTSLNYSFIAL